MQATESERPRVWLFTHEEIDDFLGNSGNRARGAFKACESAGRGLTGAVRFSGEFPNAQRSKANSTIEPLRP